MCESQKAGEAGFCESSTSRGNREGQTVNADVSQVSTTCSCVAMKGNDTESTDPHTLLDLTCFYNKHAADGEKKRVMMTKIEYCTA